MHAHMQVRRALYTSSLERWKAYKEFLPPLLRPLRDLILQYEAEGGLPSSAELLSQVWWAASSICYVRQVVASASAYLLVVAGSATAE